MHLKPLGLVVIAASFATPLIWFPPLAAKQDTIALFSQYLGLWALIAMALSQIIATRLSGIESIFGGLDRSYILHKWLGIGAMIAILFHDTIDAEMDGLGRETILVEVAETAGEISLYGFLILAVITIATFIPYHLWRWTHKFMGAFFVMSAFHFLFILKPFSNGDPLGLYVTIYCLLGILAYTYTLAPARFRAAKRYKVESVERAETVTSVTLKPTGKKPLKYRAGQFAFIGFPDAGLAEPHPFTISKAPTDDGSIRFTIATLGDYTYKLSKSLQAGTMATIAGPFGRFDYTKYKQPQIWIAAGIGVTPFVAWANTLTDTHAPITLYYSVRDTNQAAHIDELQTISDRLSNFTLILHETKSGKRLNADTLLVAQGTSLKETKVFFCGPEAMRKSLKADLHMKGLPHRAFHYEEFEIRSGIGLERLAAHLLKRVLG